MWNYNLQPVSPVSVTPAEPTVAAAPATDLAVARYSPEQVALLQNLLRDPQNHEVTAQLMRDADAAGLQNNQADSLRLLEMANTAFGNPLRIGATEQLGNDIMLATPTSQSMATLVDEQQQLVENGRSTNLNAQDQAILRSRIENLVKDMGTASPDEKIRAARALTGSPEAAEFAEQTVREITAPEQFAVLNGTPVQPAAAQQSTGSGGDAFFASLLLGANPKAEETRDNAQRLDEWRRPLSYPIGPMAQPETAVTFAAVQSVNVAASSGYEILGELSSPQFPQLASLGIGGPSNGRG